MIGTANIVNTLAAVYLNVVQVCTINPAYEMALNAVPRLPVEEIIAIQPGFCSQPGDKNPWVGRRPTRFGPTAMESCKAEQAELRRQIAIATKAKTRAISYCVSY